MTRDSGIKKILKYRMKTVDNVKQMWYIIINKKKERRENGNEENKGNADDKKV